MSSEKCNMFSSLLANNLPSPNTQYLVKVCTRIVKLFSRKSDSRSANVCQSQKPLSLLTIKHINHRAYQLLSPSTIEPIDHQANHPSSLLTTEPINHQAYWQLSLSTIEPNNHRAYWPSRPSTSGLLLQLLSLLAGWFIKSRNTIHQFAMLG